MDANTDIYIQVLLNINRNKMNTDISEAPVSYNVMFHFFTTKEELYLDNSWVHQHVIIALDYYTISIQKLIFI